MDAAITGLETYAGRLKARAILLLTYAAEDEVQDGERCSKEVDAIAHLWRKDNRSIEAHGCQGLFRSF